MSEKTAGRHDLQMRTNETFELNLTYKDSNKLPIDLTGFTAQMQVRDKPGGTVILDSSVPPNTAVITEVEGRVDVTFPLESMSVVTATRGAYDLVLTSPAGVVDALIDGSVAFVKGVTI